MSRYVDIEPYEEYVLQRHYRNSMGECIETVPLCGLPIADVQEVRHGRWIKKYRGNFVCSICGAWFRTTDEYGNIIDGEMRAKYCEECGEKMDEVEE